MARIQFRNVSKTYPVARGRRWIRHLIWDRVKGKPNRVTVLREVSFELTDGDSVALIGRNGSGKSTLLSLTAGVLEPDAGEVAVTGRIVSLLELGSGFHSELTGRENLEINAALLGLSEAQIRELSGAIIEYSGLGGYIDQPIRTYSSGMIMRLAFSIAMHVEPEVLLIDELLAVGDLAFQEKCGQTIRELKAKGKIFLCATHSALSLAGICDTAIWLEAGEIRQQGELNAVAAAYGAALHRTPDIRRGLGF